MLMEMCRRDRSNISGYHIKREGESTVFLMMVMTFG